LNLVSSDSSGTTILAVLPTARIAAYGGFMTAMN